MTSVPDAWDDEWSAAADQSAPASEAEPKRLTAKQSKAQKRAQQAEFNRKLWAEAEGPKQTNYFLESRNVVPLRQEYKAPPTLLSRKGPIIQKPRPPTGAVADLKIKDESSDDEDDRATQQKTLEEQRALAAKEREEKQRKYEERRLELFGPSNSHGVRPTSRSGGSSPVSLTPPGSRSATPSRGGKRGRRGIARGNDQPRNQVQQTHPQKDLHDPAYSAKPDSPFLLRREMGARNADEHNTPIREPRAPDGTPGFGQRFLDGRGTVLPMH